ncbi:SusC/RagA family TonB-linked outer membrane protein [Pedobacter sp.]|uniref:SusC/RagA family TonB-linked outer membrane protein n=1 Tax=Pedobacter sp. TaxID=1411316 RepID=UPI003D7FDE9D
MKKLLQSLFLFLFVANVAMAQNRTISGTVNDSTGQPIPGATVRLKGAPGAVQTSSNGSYQISAAPSATAIEVSSMGFATKTVSISGNTMNVILLDDSKALSEVVVVAYGTAKREAITGSAATLGSKDIDKRTVTNISNALSGIAPGVSVGGGNGQPGTGSTVRLRGFGSFAASSNPLYVLDGAPFDGNLGDINPNDIESVTILKDATSSALYGARAANGVIMITTKRGRTSSPLISATVNQGYSTRGVPEYDRVDANEYYPVVWQGIKNNLMFSASPKLDAAAAAAKASADVQKNLVYNPFNVPNGEIVGLDGKLNPNATLLYNDFDWYSPLTRTGKRTDANVSTSGRTENSDYYITLGYLDDKGYIQKSDFKRFNGRVNVNSQVKPWLKTGLNLSGSFSDGNIASDNATGSNSSFVNVFQFARGMGPIYPVYARDAAGNTVYNDATKADWYDYGIHPGSLNRPSGASPGRHVVYETLLNDNLYRRSLVSARSFVEVKFLKDFTFRPSISFDLRNNNNSEYRNPLIGDGSTLDGLAVNSNATTKSYTFNQVLSYNKNIGDHTFSALIAHENYDYNYRYFTANKTGLILQGNTEFANFVTPYGANGYKRNETMESYFSKFTYNYADKYFVDASLRRDGSSRFSPESRWGNFFSIGTSWSVNKENFMADVSWVDDLRVRASYGEVGNNALDSYYAFQSFYDLGWNNGSEPGLLLSTNATRDLKWESSKSSNIGMSFSLFDRRIYGDLEYYKKGSGQLIFSLPLPDSDPVKSIFKNIGSMYNSGWELQLGADLVRTQDFTWGLITNWTTLKNRITKLPAETPVITTGTKRREVGKDYYSFWLRQYAGVDQTDGSSLYIPAEGTAPANIRTIDGVDYVTNQTYAKFDYSGTAIPDLMGSFTNTFSYKNLSLSVLVNYQIGGKFYDSTYQGLMSSSSYGGAFHKDILNSWTPENPSNTPRVDYGNSTNINATSSRWLIDASYISLRNVNLTYNLPKTLIGKLDVSNARVFVSGENLGMISKRKGLDPTESFEGINANTYVPSRILSFGINFSL